MAQQESVPSMSDVDTLDCFLKLASHRNNALDKPHQVPDLQEITTTTVDSRAGATIVAIMETNNLKIATWLFHGGDGMRTRTTIAC
jgi:hypothetical protein